MAPRDAAVDSSTPADAAEGYTFPNILEQGEAASAQSGNTASKAPAIAGPIIVQVGWFRQLDEAEKVHARLDEVQVQVTPVTRGQWEPVR